MVVIGAWVALNRVHGQCRKKLRETGVRQSMEPGPGLSQMVMFATMPVG